MPSVGVVFRGVLSVLMLALVVPAMAAKPTSPQLIYQLHCEGCHKPDGSGQPGIIPSFDQVGVFSTVPKGREFLIRVPGVSQSELNNDEIVLLMNWLIGTYGHQEQTSDFEPFTIDEVDLWRGQPISNASAHRAQLVAMLDGEGSTSNVLANAESSEVAAPPPSTEPPGAFALCAACHPTSTSGAHSMGPNLRGLIGRQAGSASGFGYTGAMRDAGFSWDAETLDAFLQSPSTVVPNTSMVYGGEANPARRAQIIKYVKSLQ
jgi:cytochrome c2